MPKARLRVRPAGDIGERDRAVGARNDIRSGAELDVARIRFKRTRRDHAAGLDEGLRRLEKAGPLTASAAEPPAPRPSGRRSVSACR